MCDRRPRRNGPRSPNAIDGRQFLPELPPADSRITRSRTCGVGPVGRSQSARSGRPTSSWGRRWAGSGRTTSGSSTRTNSASSSACSRPWTSGMRTATATRSARTTPNCFAYRDNVAPLRPVGRLPYGMVIRERQVLNRFRPGPVDAVAFMSARNPVEMLDAYGSSRDGTRCSSVTAAGRTQHRRPVRTLPRRGPATGDRPARVVLARGRHQSRPAGRPFLPGVLPVAIPRLAPYTPGGGK